MSAAQRREQLIDVARKLFALKGFEGTSVEEIAATADVSKPIIYEHFGGKEGLYAVVVDREVMLLSEAIRGSLTPSDTPARQLIEQGTLALLEYIEQRPDGFRIIARDAGSGNPTGSFASIISDVASQAEDLLVEQFENTDLDPATAPIYAQALVGTIAVTGQWWLDTPTMSKKDVAAHLVNFIWYGMRGLQSEPQLWNSATSLCARRAANS